MTEITTTNDEDYGAGDVELDLWECVDQLTGKMRRTLLHMMDGKKLQTAMNLAGYAPGAGSSFIRNHPAMNQALKLLRRKEVLEHGFSAAWKRDQLAQTYRQARQLDQPSAANQTIRTMLEMDGDIKQINNIGVGGITIIVGTGIERPNNPPVTIEGEVVVEPELPDFLK